MNEQKRKGIAFQGESVFVPRKIICPNCGKVCDAEVETNEDAPFNSFVHECEHCGHMITESEWMEVEDRIRCGVQCHFEGRKITVAELKEDKIFVLSVQNTPESGKASYDMILSKEAFIGLLAMIGTFIEREGIDVNRELRKFLGDGVKLEYAVKP